MIGINLHLLADCAASNVIFDKNCHAGPPVISADKFEGLQVSGVSSGEGVMVSTGDFMSQGYAGRYVASVFEK